MHLLEQLANISPDLSTSKKAGYPPYPYARWVALIIVALVHYNFVVDGAFRMCEGLSLLISNSSHFFSIHLSFSISPTTLAQGTALNASSIADLVIIVSPPMRNGNEPALTYSFTHKSI